MGGHRKPFDDDLNVLLLYKTTVGYYITEPTNRRCLESPTPNYSLVKLYGGHLAAGNKSRLKEALLQGVKQK